MLFFFFLQNSILPLIIVFHNIEIFSELDIEAYGRVSHGETVSFQNSRLPPIIVFHMMKWFHFKLDITAYDRVSHAEIVLVQNKWRDRHLLEMGFILEFP